MGANDRFYACESLGFPEVTQYDYLTNLSVRGINDREFRWEEVAVKSVYLMQEATISGSFEYNSVIDDLAISNPTGVNVITTTSVNSTSYTGWILSGDSTVYIGMSGIQANSGDLYSLTESFYAHPIVSNEAIGLYCSGASPYPSLISTSMAVGSEGPFILPNTHQLYLNAKLNYGASGSLHTIVRGWNAGAIVAYYNPFSGEWALTPTSQSHTLKQSGYTTIKYQFVCDNFPAATPSSFDLLIYNSVSGTFVTVDDVHIDVLMKKNAFLDYIVPTGYMIQMTPDLGWHDIKAMFESTSALSNPHLKTLGPFQVEAGNLVDNLDNTVTATIDEDVFENSTSDNFKKYLWRAVAITPNGQLGAAGLPSKFEYIGRSSDRQFSVDGIQEESTSTTKTIFGKKSSSMRILVDNQENFPGLTYPTATTWKIVTQISSATRTLAIKAIDSKGTTSSTHRVKLTNNLYKQNALALWNVFDEHGLIADTQRLKNETNYEYAERIKDAYRFKGSPDFVGIVNGATRELNLKKVPDCITLGIDKNQFGTSLSSRVQYEVTPYSIRISSSMFVVTERLYVDPVHRTVTLSKLPFDTPRNVISDKGKDLKSTDVEVILFEDESRKVYKLKVHCDVATYVDVTYTYYEEYLFKEFPTVGDVVQQLRSITASNGQPLLVVTLSALLSGNEDSLGLYITNGILNSTDPITIGWSPVFIKKLTDKGYKDYFLNSTNTLKQTEYYSYVEELKRNTKVFWGAVETDRDRWDAADSKSLAMESIPTLFDPPLSRILSSVSGESVIVEPITAWGRNYLGYNQEQIRNLGLKSALFQPGVAHKHDLVPDLYLTSSYINISNPLDGNIGPIRNDNNYVIFSGQK